MQETQDALVPSLGQEDPLEKKMATLQYSCLENAMDRGAWRAMVCGVAKRWTRLSTSRYAPSLTIVVVVRHLSD